jgi:3-dehydroquinate synthase
LKTSTVVPVNLGSRSYKIHILPGLIEDFSTLLAETVSPAHIVVFTDDVVENLYLSPVKKCLEQIARIDSIVVPAGEKSKSVAQCDRLWQRLVEIKADRKTAIVALGGGVIGDLAGFIAASFARGLDFVQIPTTLLAQVDSSVGGKVGINLPQAKNMVGAFWQPQTVLIDPRVLSTLDERNYRAGLAEVIKYGVIMDLPLFEFLENSVDAINERDPESLSRVIAWCCRCKSSVVEADETETSGQREILNYGHTFGHAIEAVFGYGDYLHGEAIAIGMTCAARLAASNGLADKALLERQTRLFEAFGLSTKAPAERLDELVNAMKHDKKTVAGKLNLILPTQLGNVQRVPAPDDATLRNSFINGSFDE